MTYKQFLARLRKTPRKWRLVRWADGTKRELIRCGGVGVLDCPIEVVGGTKDAHDAGGAIGLRPGVVWRIIRAADGKPGPTRRDLLRACNLKERK